MGWFIAGLILGVFIGANIHDDREARTLEQLDGDMRRDLERYRNLSTSLLEDVKYWRDRYNTLHNIKDNK